MMKILNFLYMNPTVSEGVDLIVKTTRKKKMVVTFV